MAIYEETDKAPERVPLVFIPNKRLLPTERIRSWRTRTAAIFLQI